MCQPLAKKFFLSTLSTAIRDLAYFYNVFNSFWDYPVEKVN